MMQSKELLALLREEHKVGAKEEKDYSKTITTGIVVDTDDPLQMGRLRVFCPNLNDDPKKIHHLPWAVYVPPFGGVISSSQYARGVGTGPENTDGSVAYGFWGIPEQGAKVIVACIDGDIRRRVWLGTMHEHQETHTLFHGRYNWSDGSGEPDGPLSSTKSPIEPLYTNMGKAVNGDRESREWKTRFADYQPTAVSPFEEPPNEQRGDDYIDDLNAEMFENETDDWVKPILGAHGYDWSGNKGVGSHLASRVFGFSTPGGHAISFDDRAYNSRIRIRSATGQQIILDDTNERIYLSTNEGANWIELDSSGNIDIFAERRVSIHAEKDINFSTDETFRVKAKKGIYMYAGDTEGQTSLEDEKPEDGEIRFHSTGDTHLMVEKNLRMLIEDDWLSEIGGKTCTTIAEEMFLQVEEGIDIIVNDGDYQVSINGDYSHHASGDNSLFAGNDTQVQSVNDVEVFSFTGLMDIGSQLDMTIKSYESNITIEAIKDNVLVMGNGGNAQIETGNSGVSLFSTNSVNVQSADEYNVQCFPGFGVDPVTKEPTLNNSPLPSDCVRIPGALNVSFKEKEIDFGLEDGDMQFDVGDGVKTSITNINEKFAQIESRFNDAIGTLHAAVDELVGKTGFPLDLSFTLPSFPALSFNIAVPNLELPNFDFNFCLQVDPLIQVPTYNPFPDGAFINVGADLGGWTKNSIKGWANRQKSNFDSSVNRIQNAFSASIASVPATITQMQNNITSIVNSLDNLVNVSVTDNGLQLFNYSTGINNLLNDVRQHNANIASHNASTGASVPDLGELENELSGHSRRMDELGEQAQVNPSILNSEDFSDLEDLIPLWQEFLDDLGDIA